MTTWQTTSARIAGFGIATVALATAPLAAAPQTTVATYVVQSIIAQQNGTLTATEKLTITATDGSAAVTIQQSNGETANTTMPIDGHGILGVQTADPALICYNSAQGIVADGATSAAGAALQVAFAGNSVNVPISVAHTSIAGGQQFTIGGTVAGTFNAAPQTGIAIVIDGAIRTQRFGLTSASLRETTLFTANRAPIGQTSCSLSRVLETQPGAPA